MLVLTEYKQTMRNKRTPADRQRLIAVEAEYPLTIDQQSLPGALAKLDQRHRPNS